MTAIFTLSGLAIFAIFAGIIGLMLLVSMVALRIFHSRTLRHRDVLPVPTFLTAITTLWALSIGFAAADIWTVRADAERVASEERSAISRLAGMAHETVLESPELEHAIRLYKERVTENEWGNNANRLPDEDVDQAVQMIRIAVADLSRDGTSPAMLTKLVGDFDELQDARSKRLGIGMSSYSAYKWYLVGFLTFLSMIVIAAINADRPRAARKALVLFAAGALGSLWILALHANPYAGAIQIDIEAIRFPIDRL